jgi:hypothetical protein
MSSGRSTESASRLEQIRSELHQRWIEDELERINDAFLSTLQVVVAHCDELCNELSRQQLMEQELQAQLTFADKLRFKLGTHYSSRRMSAAAQELSLVHERIVQLQKDIALNSPGARASSPGDSSMLLNALAQNDRAVRLARASNNRVRSAWVEEQLKNQLIDERAQLTQQRKEVVHTRAQRKASRSSVALTVIIEGKNGILEGVTRDISGTGAFVELNEADKTFIEGELLTLQVSGLPAESTAVRGVAVRVSSHGLGVRLLSENNALLQSIENPDELP